MSAGLRPSRLVTEQTKPDVALVPIRPLYARAASDNVGSLRVLQKSGFKIIGTQNSFAPGRNGIIEETVLRRG
jgi:hypothetical protein